MIRFSLPASILLFFIAWVFPVPVIAGIWTHQLNGDNLAADCKFNLGTQEYDLCPLLREHLVVEAEAEKEASAVEYELMLNGSIGWNTVRAGADGSGWTLGLPSIVPRRNSDLSQRYVVRLFSNPIV